MSKLLTLWNFIGRHKYIITLIIFGIIIVFLDENSLIQRARHKDEIKTLKNEISKYRVQFEEDTERLKEITNNPEALEKIAREKYLMKKPNEDIFIFEE
ncbi:MAG: septum formation initiator family protein [Bacteroides sp.]|nr:septum formation initiator family protein [Bacteroides sp.]